MADNDADLIVRFGERLKSLEMRISRLENTLTAEHPQIQQADNPEISEYPDDRVSSGDEDKGFESRLGRYGFAWMGNFVLLFGIIFMTVYLVNTGHRVLSVLIGYISSSLIFYFAWYLKKSNEYLSFIFRINAQVLLFYITLRLHFFSTTPLLGDKTVASCLLIVIIALQVYFAVRDRAQVFAVLAILFTLVTGFITDSKQFLPVLVMISAGVSFFLYYKFRWETLVILSAITSYFSVFLWLLGNPFMGHTLQLDTSLNSGVYYACGLGTIFSLLLLFRERDHESGDFLVGITFVNGVLFTILLTFLTMGFFKNNYVVLYSILSVFCLLFSVYLHSISDWNFGSAFYALYGFMTMSIALYGVTGFPGIYFLLSIQSLVVVTMALWFRNRLIIVMNSLLFLSILLVYVLQSEQSDIANFSFALVAFISARLINWKKERLQIKTGLMRNVYLSEGFIMLLLALLHAVPKQFVTLSWAIAALVYFLIGSLLKNIKYRYLALGTMICAAFYFFIVDLAKIDIIYRVLALLFLAAISIGISMYYSLHLKKADN